MMNNIPFKNSDIARLTGMTTQPDQLKSDKKRIRGNSIKVNRQVTRTPEGRRIEVDKRIRGNNIKVNIQVTKTPEGRHIEVEKFNRLTGKGVSKEKDITFKSKGSPREKYVEKQVVKRDSDLNWKSEKKSRRLSSGGKKIKSESSFNTYDNH